MRRVQARVVRGVSAVAVVIVTMTTSQFVVCLTGVDNDPHAMCLCGAAMSNVSRTKADYDMPYIAWVAVFKQLFERAYISGELKVNRKLPGKVTRAIRAIATGLNAWERMPALRNIAQLHWQPGPVVPAWAMPFGHAWASTNTMRPWITDWAPFPIEGVQPMLLVPDHFTNGSVPMTRWLPVERFPANRDWVPGDDAVEASFKDLAATFIIPVGVKSA